MECEVYCTPDSGAPKRCEQDYLLTGEIHTCMCDTTRGYGDVRMGGSDSKRRCQVRLIGRLG